MKNTTGKKKSQRKKPQPKKPLPYPSKETQWAYWMQAIEPTSQAINEAFPGYHPQWVQMSQIRSLDGERFTFMRKLLGMTQKQCAAYLRTGEATVRRWESDKARIPFAAFELLRVIWESVRFKMSHQEWDGWFITDKGILVSPFVGGAQGEFTPGRLNYIASQGTEASRLRGEVNRLQAELNKAQEENTRLRQMYVSHGVVDELAAMQETISDLMSRIATARVIPFHATSTTQPQEAAA